MRIGIGHIHGLGQGTCSGPLDPLCGEAAPSAPSDVFTPDASYAAQSASSIPLTQQAAAGVAPLTTNQLSFLTGSSTSSTGTVLAIAAVAILGFLVVAKR